MIGMRIVRQVIALAALVAATSSCGDVVRQGRSPVYLVVSTLTAAQGNHISQLGTGLSSDVITNVTSPAPCTDLSPCPTVFGDVGQVTLRISLKDIGTPAIQTAPTANNDVTITRYHVGFRRADGRNTPGIDVPYAFDGFITGTVSGIGSLSLGFTLVRNTAKEEAPLVQLIFSPNIISAIADVTFYGHDQVGNEVSVTGSLDVAFGNFGD
jgi:hypothetical protein